MIFQATSAAVLMITRLDRWWHSDASGTADDDMDIDERIARGDRMVAYDVLSACIRDLEEFREQLGEMLLGAEAMARLAALAARKEAERC